MIDQITIDDLLRKDEPKPKIVIPVSKYDGEKVYTIPEDVWETRCIHCQHKNADENTPIPHWAMWKYMYDKIIPCRVMGIARMHDRPGECMSFTPKYGTYGICESCKHNNCFFDEFCMKEDHAPQRRVYYGTDYGGDERKIDYYSRHRLSVCDDYEPDDSVKEVP